MESSTVERVEEIEEEQVDVDELEFEAEYASGEDGEEDEDYAELTKNYRSRRPSRTTQADQ